MKIQLNAKTASVFGALGAVLFPSLCGVAVHFGNSDIATGLAVSALLSIGVGLLGYLSIPSEPGEFQQVDLRSVASKRRQ